jgi:hypothetical protein
MARKCGCGNEIFGVMESKKFIQRLVNYQHLKNSGSWLYTGMLCANVRIKSSQESSSERSDLETATLKHPF